MKLCEKFTKNNVDTSTYYFEFTCVDTCPICKSKIDPVYVASSLDTLKLASVLNHCRSCKNSFVTQYSVSESHRHYNGYPIIAASNIVHCEPNRFVAREFDMNIKKLSPQFTKIYNQALSAETMKLDEIAGLGYRKSLEFLVKDFAIHEHPEDAENIKNKPLAQCIKLYIDNPHIVTLAERSAWIGNDEAHYIRKQEGRDVSDMKSFIQAIVYFVGMILITEDAASMVPKK